MKVADADDGRGCKAIARRMGGWWLVVEVRAVRVVVPDKVVSRFSVSTHPRGLIPHTPKPQGAGFVLQTSKMPARNGNVDRDGKHGDRTRRRCRARSTKSHGNGAAKADLQQLTESRCQLLPASLRVLVLVLFDGGVEVVWCVGARRRERRRVRAGAGAGTRRVG